MIQTDAPTALGSSSGPASGDEANVIGLMTFVSLSSGSGRLVQGFNFLIPATGRAESSCLGPRSRTRPEPLQPRVGCRRRF